MKKDFIDITILRICRQPRTFEFISKNLSGYEPTQTISRLQALSVNGDLIHKDDFWLTRDRSIVETPAIFPEHSKHYFQKYMGHFDFLKTPHPLDFEWRNSTNSLNTLIDKVQTTTHPEDKILILGMPTLFATAVQKGIPNAVTLIERNGPIVHGLEKIIGSSQRYNVLQKDIFIITPELVKKHQGVIMDPPWYSPHFFQFLWLAAQCTAVGGFVAISLPPINTRPTVAKERIEWFSFCEKLGLCIETLEPQLLQYAMPFFEFNAFRAAGIEGLMPFWRKGDFALFRKMEESTFERPKISPMGVEWEEREYKSVRFRINTGSDQTSQEPLSIESIVKADILPTISSRDERRSKANVWTSGNRIFKTNNPKVLLALIDAVIYSKTLEFTDGFEMVQNFVERIAELESNEYKNYMDWIYYEMERQIIG